MSNDFPHAGTVISGTHRPQDLIPAFWGVLNELDAERATRISRSHPYGFDFEAEDYNDDDADALIDALTEALNALAPEGWYFGSLEGDGADFGFWRTDDCTCGAQGLPRDQHRGDCPVFTSGVPQVTRCNGRWSNYA